MELQEIPDLKNLGNNDENDITDQNLASYSENLREALHKSNVRVPFL